MAPSDVRSRSAPTSTVRADSDHSESFSIPGSGHGSSSLTSSVEFLFDGQGLLDVSAHAHVDVMRKQARGGMLCAIAHPPRVRHAVATTNHHAAHAPTRKEHAHTQNGYIQVG